MKKVGKTTQPFRYDLNQIPYDYTVEVTNRLKGLDLIDRVPDELSMDQDHSQEKKYIDIKGTFRAKMGTIKDRHGMDLTEAEDIKKRWQEYTEELYRKDLHDPDNHDSVITHLETSWNVKSSGP